MMSLALIALKLEGFFYIWLRCGVDEGFQSIMVMVILSAVSTQLDFPEDVSPLIQEGSSAMTNSTGLHVGC